MLCRLIQCGLLVAVVSALGATAQAAERADPFEIGEEVEVFFLMEWRPGVVKNTNRRGDVLVEFAFAAARQERVFPAAQVIHKYESGALARGRTWTDATGKFRTKAALLSLTEGQAALRTPEGKELKIPLEKLSAADQQFLKSLQQEPAGPVATGPKPTPLTEFDISGSSSLAGVGPTLPHLAPDPSRTATNISEAGVTLPALQPHESLTALLPLGGAEQWVIASVADAFGSRGNPSRLFWLSLAQKKVQRVQSLPAGEVVIDYHAPSQQLLTLSREQSALEPPALAVWKTGPTTEQPASVIAWQAHAPSASLRGPQSWFRFASDRIVIQQDSSPRIYAWDIVDKKLLWDSPQQSFFAPQPVLSPGGRYLFVPEDAGVRVVEIGHGENVGVYATNTSCSALAAHADGKRLAILARNELIVLDYTTGSATTQDASTIGTPFAARLHWVNDELLAVEQAQRGFALYSLRLRLPVLNYEFHMSTERASTRDDMRTRTIVEQHLLYAATYQHAGQSGTVVGAARLPGAAAESQLAAIRREDFLALRLGSAIRIDANQTAAPAPVASSLQSKVVANGWRVDPNAQNVLRAVMEQGEAQTVRYQMHASGSGAQERSVTFTPHISRLELVVNGKVAWSSGSGSGPPPVVFLNKNQSLESEMQRWNQPNPGFFDTVQIPNEIVDPERLNGLGTVEVTNRGLILGAK